MMVEVRARAADVETGVSTGPVRRRNVDEPIPPSGFEAPKPRRANPDRPAAQPAPPAEVRIEAVPEPVVAPPPARDARRDDRIDLLEQPGVLCLGDLPPEAPASSRPVASPPWARGLRG
jgi:hypothetical protein